MASTTRKTSVRKKPVKAVDASTVTPVKKETKPNTRIEIMNGILEKGPLFLAVSYQSYIVGLWSFVELQKVTSALNLGFTNALFSIFAGLSLDLIMIGTALRKDTKNITHLITLFTAWIASSLIAYTYFNGDLLHVTWSTMVFMFSWSLAEGRGNELLTLLINTFRRKKNA